MVEINYSPERHKEDVYVQKVTVLTTHVAGAPLVQGFTLPNGIIHKVMITFPRGCNRHVIAQLWQHGVMWLPNNTGLDFNEMGHEHPLELPGWREVWEDETDFEIRAWNDGTVFCNHALVFLFMIELASVI